MRFKITAVLLVLSVWGFMAAALALAAAQV